MHDHLKASSAAGRLFFLALFTAVFGGFSLPAKAIVIQGLDSVTGGLNTVAPTGFEEGWQRTGQFGVGSAVYLGNGYILSAAHVSTATDFIVGGVSHQVISGTRIDLSNSGAPGSLSALSDVSLLRVRVPEESALQGLPVLTITQNSPAGTNMPGMMIGYGRGQTTTSPINLGPSLEGYAWGSGLTREERWAGVLISNATTIEIGINNRDLVGMASFSFSTANQRGHATNGDSGGGLFITGTNGIELAGIIHAVTSFNGQTANSSSFGNKTLFSDLSFYADQINVVEGDLTGDGYVGADDLDLVLANWGDSVLAGDWFAGDASGDGVIGQADLDYVLNNWGAGQLPVPTVVPTPATGVMVCLLGVGLFRRNRKCC